MILFLLFIILSTQNTLLWVFLNKNNKNTYNAIRYSRRKRRVLLIPPCSLFYVLYKIFKGLYGEIISSLRDAFSD